MYGEGFKMNYRNKKVIAAAAAGFIILSIAWYAYDSKGQAVSYRTDEIRRGDLLATIAATGTVEPEEVIDVGAQVAGRIIAFGKDKDGKIIDYGSNVEEGTVLAQIDDSLYSAEMAQASAQLAQSQAEVKRSEADLLQMKAKLYQAQNDWERAQKLGSSDALSQSSFDAYKSGYEIAKANVSVSEAGLTQAQAMVTSAEASLDRAKQNLGYCVIKSPVKGVIIDRRVNIGQTVVSSFNAPSLFLLAKDLRRMQLWVAVNEADIGHIHAGQAVTFRVDAFPGEIFNGEVGKVRLNATMTQNVVTYTVEVITDNSNGKLIPYLSANVQFELTNRKDVLLVANSALRWTPPSEQIAGEYQMVQSNGGHADANNAGRQAKANGNTKGNSETKQGTLWVKQGSKVRPIKVRVGFSDGTNTEVQGDEVKEGLEVVLGEAQKGAVSSNTTNPFVPQIRRR
jgi:HlyD family secretion protein